MKKMKGKKKGRILEAGVRMRKREEGKERKGTGEGEEEEAEEGRKGRDDQRITEIASPTSRQ